MATKQAKTRKSPSKKTKQKPFKERVKSAMKEEQKVYTKHGVGRRLFINFPNKTKIPFLGKIGMKLAQWSGGVIDIKFTDTFAEKDNK